MDRITFIFALSSPLVAILLTLFANISSVYVERASQDMADSFKRAGLPQSLQDSINIAIRQVSQSALLISNYIVTAVNVVIGLFAATYFLKDNYVTIYIAILIFIVFLLAIVKVMVQYGLKNLYSLRVRRLIWHKRLGAAYGFTYGAAIDIAMLLMNLALAAQIIIIYALTRPLPS